MSSWGTLTPRFSDTKKIVLKGDTFTIGRSRHNQYVVKDPCVSTVHVRITNEKGDVFVVDESTNGTWLNAKRLRKGVKVKLEENSSHVLSVVFNDKITKRKSFEIKIFPKEKVEDETKEKEDSLQNYKIGNTLGSGAFATVKLATCRSTGETFAMKIVEKKKFAMIEFGRSSKNSESEKIMREVDILQQCDHPNITKCYNVFDTPKRLYILLELVKGGELFDRLVDRGAFSESKARHIFRQLTRGIAYLHSRGISHRDIKPENILLQEDGMSIKISDFGMSRLTSGGSFMKTIAGTPQYVAPEVLTDTGESGKGYGKEADLWSLGVVLYVLLSARMPFGDASRAGSVFEQVRRCEYSFPSQVFGNISDEAIDLIRKLLVKDPSKRLNATQILVHPWLTADRNSLECLKKSIERWRKRDLAKAMLSWTTSTIPSTSSNKSSSSRKRKGCVMMSDDNHSAGVSSRTRNKRRKKDEGL